MGISDGGLEIQRYGRYFGGVYRRFARVLRANSGDCSIIQKCIVHQMRNSLKYVEEVDKKPVIKDLRQVYTSTTKESARTVLTVLRLNGAKNTSILSSYGRKIRGTDGLFGFSIADAQNDLYD